MIMHPVVTPTLFQTYAHQLDILLLPKQCEALHSQAQGVCGCVCLEHPEEQRSPPLAVRYLHKRVRDEPSCVLQATRSGGDMLADKGNHPVRPIIRNSESFTIPCQNA